MLFKVQGVDFSSYLTNMQMKLVRTYKKEVTRTQAGVVAAFPASFVTVGFELQFLGPRADMELLEQILLSYDTVEVITDYNGTTIKGKFSSTSNDKDEVRDRGNASLSLKVSIVSDGTNITKENGSAFTVKYNGSSIVSTAYFGKRYFVGTNYKKNGAALPSGYLLVLGDEIVTT